MNSLLAGLLGVILSTNQTLAASNLVQQTTGISVPVEAPADDPVKEELRRIMIADETALEEAEKIIAEAREFAAKGSGEKAEDLGHRLDNKLADIRRMYSDFIQKNPTNTDAMLAYGSFLQESGREEEGVEQWEKARALDPKNPATWNNLANHYGHRGPVKKAFEYYEKAIELAPNEPVYIQNLATTTYLFRKDAKEHYNIDEQKVFDRALELYERAMKLDPTNFLAAADLAQTYYGIRPLRREDALKAWTRALELAKTDLDREGVYVHLARVETLAGRFDPAKEHLAKVKHPELEELKRRVTRTIEQKSKPEGTNVVTEGTVEVKKSDASAE